MFIERQGSGEGVEEVEEVEIQVEVMSLAVAYCPFMVATTYDLLYHKFPRFFVGNSCEFFPSVLLRRCVGLDREGSQPFNAESNWDLVCFCCFLEAS